MIDVNNRHDVAAAVESNAKQILKHRTLVRIKLIQYGEFADILKIKYNNNEKEINKNHNYEFDRVVSLGLKQWGKEDIGYEIIHIGKPADKRILKQLGKIAYELKLISTYPKLDAIVLPTILNKSLGDMDPRTKKKYRETILYYCNIDEEIIKRCTDSRLGQLDVSGFVKRVPRQYVVGC